MFSDHNVIKLEINNKQKFGKFINMWKFKNTFLNNQWIKEEIRKYFEMNEIENITF